MDKKKTLTLTFTPSSAVSLGDDEYYTVLDVHSAVKCSRCQKWDDSDESMLFLGMKRYGKKNFHLAAELFCHDCGTQQLTHYNRIRECSSETSSDKRLGACLRKKEKEEQSGP